MAGGPERCAWVCAAADCHDLLLARVAGADAMVGSGRVAGLDGMRALAVAMVIATHVVPSITTGGAGVSIFFVLSGYLITGVLLNDVDRSGRIRRGLFYARRALRLWPALLAMLVVVVAIGAPVTSAAIAATYTTNLFTAFGGQSVEPFGHTWSLALEEQFYLLWPLLLPLCLRARRASIAILVAVALASTVAGWIGGLHAAASGHPLAVYNPLWTAHGLVIGCILALAIRGRPIPPRRWTEGGVALLAAAIGIGRLDGSHPAWFGWNALTPELAAALMIVGLLGSRTTFLTRIFALPPVVWAGRRSYAIYLWHLPLILEFSRHGIPHASVIAVAATLVAAELSARYVEAPFLRIKDRLGSSGNRHQQSDPGVAAARPTSPPRPDPRSAAGGVDASEAG